MKNQLWKHDKATDAWQALRIHGEFIKGFDELTTIGPCISIFGSARTQPDDEFYQKATKLSELIVSNGYGIITGGGPGIMEAANLGASNLNGNSVGLQIELPFESSANEYVDKLVSCRYFFTRKVFFLKYSQAFVAFPGGFGTFDEIFETLTLIQTGHMRSVPIVFMDSNFWGGLFEWIKNTMLSQGKISKEDLEMYKLVDSPEEAMEYILSKLNTNAPNF
tara:strand:+ start:7262 stop:7924 length:663 start_codon:yes stop_codon:yes gene_type:complete